MQCALAVRFLVPNAPLQKDYDTFRMAPPKLMLNMAQPYSIS